MFSFKSVYFVIFTLITHLAQGEISDKRLCIDKSCSEPIARGVTLLKYSSPEANVLSFGRNENVIIYSYGAGNRPELIGVEIGGKRGYVNKNHIRESVLVKKPSLTLDTEIVTKPEVSIEVPKDEIKAAPTQEAYEIVDGTKIPLDVAASTTDVPLQTIEEKQRSSEETKPLIIGNLNLNEPVIQTSTEQKLQPVANVKVGDIPNVIIEEDFEDDDDEEDEDEDDLNDKEEEITTKKGPEIKEQLKINTENQDVVTIKQDISSQNIKENLQQNEIPKRVNEENIDLNLGSIAQQRPLDVPAKKLPESLHPNAESASNTTAEVPVTQNLVVNGLEKNQQTAGIKATGFESLESSSGSIPKVPAAVQDLPNNVAPKEIQPQDKGADPLSPENDPNISEAPAPNIMTAPTEIPPEIEIEMYPTQEFDPPVTPDPAKLNPVEPNEESKVEPPAGGVLGSIFSMLSSSPENDKTPDSTNENKDFAVENKVNALEPPAENTLDPMTHNLKSSEEAKDEAVAENAGIFSVFGVSESQKTPEEITEKSKVEAHASHFVGTNPKISEEIKVVPLEISGILPIVGSDSQGEKKPGEVPTNNETNVVVPKDAPKSVGTNPMASEEIKVEVPLKASGILSIVGSDYQSENKSEEVPTSNEGIVVEPKGGPKSVGTNPTASEEMKVELPVETSGILSIVGSDYQSEKKSEEVPTSNETIVVVPKEAPKQDSSDPPTADFKEPLPDSSTVEIKPIVEQDASVENDLSFEESPNVDINVEPPPKDNLVVENMQENDKAENQAESDNSRGIFSSLFGMGSAVQNVDADKVPIDDFQSSNLDVNIEENAGENVQMESTGTKDFETILSESIPQNTEFCDSKSERCPQIAKQGFCDKESQDCPNVEYIKQLENGPRSISSTDFEEIFIAAFSSNLFLYLTTTALSVLILIFVWTLLDKCRREGPLIARINKLEQQLLATSKENEMLQERAAGVVEEKAQLVVETVPNEVVEELNTKISDLTQAKLDLEDQVAALEKELDNSTEMGMELNKIISEMLSSTDGSEILRENIEQMQKKVLEQQDTINTLNDSISIKETEMYEIRLELDISNKKVADLKGEMEKMFEKILKLEEEKEQQHSTLETELTAYQDKCQQALTQEHNLRAEIFALNQSVAELQRTADMKVKEYSTLKDTLSKIKSMNNDKDKIKSFLDITETKAQLEQMKSENLKYSQQLTLEKDANASYSAQIETLTLEVKELREKYEKSDKQKVEVNTKLEVLNNYFKEKEEQLQKEISRYESLWAAKEGEATSTTERLRYMHEELQNYKAQNESLKQEIMNQEVELKSQISMLEKKSHENWVANRQTERKLEEARQEAAQLRNRLTMRERAFAEGNNHMRMQSPLHQNGELPLSPPPPLDPTQSPPPILFNHRDHITKSPPIPGLPPPPFLPPPLGAGHFIPPPPLDGMMPPPMGDMGMPPPPFIPGLHHPGMFPGDRRPPPLGRMSSPPPVGGRYSPESTVYSEYDRYDRRSPSPPYDSEYGASPPPIRGYSPYDDRGDRGRDDRRGYKRPQPRSNGRHTKGMHSSGSENDSLGKISKKPQRKV